MSVFPEAQAADAFAHATMPHPPDGHSPAGGWEGEADYLIELIVSVIPPSRSSIKDSKG